MPRQEATENDIREAFQALFQQGWTYKQIKELLLDEFKKRRIDDLIQEGMTSSEAEQYIGELYDK